MPDQYFGPNVRVEKRDNPQLAKAKAIKTFVNLSPLENREELLQKVDDLIGRININGSVEPDEIDALAKEAGFDLHDVARA